MAYGLFGGGDGSESNPYIVEDFADVNAIKNHLVTANIYFQQKNDIEFNYNGDWHPIGDYAGGPFGGIYDGAGYKISNVITIAKEGHPAGLFGFIQSTSILKNINVVNVSVTGEDYAGGLVGHQQGLVERCTTTGIINGNQYVGGLIGLCQRNITQCSSQGAIHGDNCVGGLVGSGSASVEPIIIADSYAITDVAGTQIEYGKVGGLIGNSVNIQVDRCFSQGKVTSSSVERNYVGGLIGSASQTAVTSSYYDIEKSELSDTGKGTPKTTAELQNIATFIGWDFENVWKMVHGQLLLQFEPDPEPPTPIIPSLQAQFFAKIGGQWFRLDSNN